MIFPAIKFLAFLFYFLKFLKLRQTLERANYKQAPLKSPERVVVRGFISYCINPLEISCTII